MKCWLCHEYAPSGVCTRTHDYTPTVHARAQREHNIEGGVRYATYAGNHKARIQREASPRRPYGPRRPPCPWCHGAVTPDRLGDWCEACERIVPQQQQRRVA